MSADEDYPPFEFEFPELESARDRDVILGQREMADAILASLGGGGSPVDTGPNSYEFAKKFDLRVDGVPITGPTGLDGDYEHLLDWYLDEHRFQVAMAGAQTGKTARLLVHLARTCYSSAYGRLVGYYFPDKHLPGAFSRERFKPFVRSNPKLAKTLGAPKGGGSKGTDATLTMSLGETTLYFMTIGGRTATEGLPLKAVYFDEVRRMKLGDIERAQERYSAQTRPVDFKVSTAKYPKGDIHKFFLAGDQRYFHTECDCADGVVLSESFPNCIADMRNATPTFKKKVAHAFRNAKLPYLGMTEEDRAQYPDAVYLCPSCGKILVNPRVGYWLPHAPDHWVHSYQLPQMLTPTYPAGRMLHKFEHAEDMQEVHNSGLGLPYVDREKMPLQEEHVDACVDSSLSWGEHLSHEARRRRLTNCTMGIDVQAGYGIAVVKWRAPSGKHRTVHLEVLRSPGKGKTWWHRAAQLMHRYDVRLAVIDEAPEYSDSLAFAQAFRGRVFLSNFALSDKAPRFVQWDDELLADDVKQKGDTASRHRVSMDRTRALHWSLMRWKNRWNEIPALGSLVQVLPLDTDGQVLFSAHLRMGTPGPASMGFVLRSQLVVWVFRDVYDDADLPARARQEAERQGKKRWVAEFIGGQSPDFAMADLYASVALDRVGTPSGVGRLG